MSNKEVSFRELVNLPSSQEFQESSSDAGTSTPLSFEEVYRQNADRVLNLLFRFTNNEESAKDLLQDVFLKAFQNFESFENRSELATWIHRIAVNHALNFLKRERRTVWFNVLDQSVGTLLQKETVELPGWHSGVVPRPDHILEARELEELVGKAVHDLPLKYRLPYLLHRDGELGNPEIAKTLSISISATETRIYRAKKMLLKKLKPLFSA